MQLEFFMGKTADINTPRLKGSLREKLGLVKEVNTNIRSLEARGIKSSTGLDRLLERRCNLEVDIARHLMSGGRLANPVYDYCFRNFGGVSLHINGETNYKTVFDVIPRVRRFVGVVESVIGLKVLSAYGEGSAQTGVVSGSCGVDIKGSFRNLYIPVKQLFVLSQEGKWVKGEDVYEGGKTTKNNTHLQVNSDIFRYPSRFNLGGEFLWQTEHSGERYVGGSGPEETSIYLGNDAVNQRVIGGMGFKVVVPAREIRVEELPKY